MRSFTLFSVCILFALLIDYGYSAPVDTSNPVAEKGKEIANKVKTDLKVLKETIKAKFDENLEKLKKETQQEKASNPKAEEIKKDKNDEDDEESDDETETEIVTEVVTEIVEEEGTTIVYEDEDDTTTEAPTNDSE